MSRLFSINLLFFFISGSLTRLLMMMWGRVLRWASTFFLIKKKALLFCQYSLPGLRDSGRTSVRRFVSGEQSVGTIYSRVRPSPPTWTDYRRPGGSQRGDRANRDVCSRKREGYLFLSFLSFSLFLSPSVTLTFERGSCTCDRKCGMVANNALDCILIDRLKLQSLDKSGIFIHGINDERYLDYTGFLLRYFFFFHVLFSRFCAKNLITHIFNISLSLSRYWTKECLFFTLLQKKSLIKSRPLIEWTSMLRNNKGVNAKLTSPEQTRRTESRRTKWIENAFQWYKTHCYNTFIVYTDLCNKFIHMSSNKFII